MNKEKLYEFADEQSSLSTEFGYYTVHHLGIIKGADYVMSLPLAERLTDEEKKTIQELYKTSVTSLETYRLHADLATNHIYKRTAENLVSEYEAKISLLIDIFGSELFIDKN